MAGTRTLVVATRNRGKLAEITDIVKLDGWTIVGLDNFLSIGEIEESGASFEENALAKARAVTRLTGMPSIADDSGLVVDALGGQPGPFSARFAGENATDTENNEKLLKMMSGVSSPNRGARFVCVMAVVMTNGKEITARGVCEGTILDAPRGKHGFGYDPLFYYPPAGKTFAEMRPEEKNLVSHRAAALSKLKEALPSILTGGENKRRIR